MAVAEGGQLAVSDGGSSAAPSKPCSSKPVIKMEADDRAGEGKAQKRKGYL